MRVWFQKRRHDVELKLHTCNVSPTNIKNKMLVDLSKKEIQSIMSSLMNDDTTHTELYEKLSNLNQVCTCKEDSNAK